jgi:hypothetical protein
VPCADRRPSLDRVARNSKAVGLSVSGIPVDESPYGLVCSAQCVGFSLREGRDHKIRQIQGPSGECEDDEEGPGELEASLELLRNG